MQWFSSCRCIEHAFETLTTLMHDIKSLSLSLSLSLPVSLSLSHTFINVI